MEIINSAAKDMTGYDAKLTTVHAAQLDPSQDTSCAIMVATMTIAISSIARDIAPTILYISIFPFNCGVIICDNCWYLFVDNDIIANARQNDITIDILVNDEVGSSRSAVLIRPNSRGVEIISK